MLHAIQVHPHDVRDEGAELVVERIVERAGLRVVAPEVMTVEERHPYPRGELPHNPLHRVVVTEARLEVPLGAAAFDGLPFRPVVSQRALAGYDYIGELVRVAASRGVRMVPWIKALNGAFSGQAPVQQMLDGEPVPTWLCPSRPETREYLVRLVEAVMERYEVDALLLDRLRYPDWSGARVCPQRLLTCFCDACVQAMSKEGIDVRQLTAQLSPLSHAGDDPASFVAFWRAYSEQGPTEDLRAWLAFRTRAITTLARDVRAALDARLSGATFWLNLWPPSFGWLLGQDMRALAPVCDGAKIFPYHRLGGGADLAGLVKAVSPRPSEQEEVFRAFTQALGLPYGLSFDEFQVAGLPIDFVGDETRKAVEAFGPRRPVFAGIQIWDTPLEEIPASCGVAKAAGAAGFFHYCYGWASLEALDVVGRVASSLR